MRAADLTSQQQAELVSNFKDHPRFCRESLYIRERIGSSVPFEPWPSQLKLNAAIQSQRKKGPVRKIILKTRRSGFTMGACSEMFHDVPFFPGRRGLIIADKYDPAGLEAFDYLVQFQIGYRPFGGYIRLPRLLKPQQPVTPVPKGATLELMWENTSAIDVMSAEGGNVGRGGGRHFILADEAAFWRIPETTLTALLNMVPDLPETSVIIQSTANGIGGEFYELCQTAMDPANSSGWEFLFFGWLEHPLYRRAVEDPVKFQASMDRDEHVLMEMHGATFEQLSWRRAKIATECRGHLEIFHQEYPTTAGEAFLASGRQALTVSTLVRMPVWKEPIVGEIQEIEEFPKKKLRFVMREHGALTIGRKPDPNRMYVIGSDPSKGVDVSDSGRGTNPDWSVGFVVDLESGEQVAMLRERLRPTPFAEYLALLGRLYGYAFLVPESNDAGFIDALLRTNYPAERIYNTRRDPTDRRSVQPQEIGFYTDTTTRPWLITALDDALRDAAIIIRSPIAQQEIRTFVIKPNGKQEHQLGCHDDCVIAAALAAIGMRYAPRRVKQLSEKPRGYAMYGIKRRNREDED